MTESVLAVVHYRLTGIEGHTWQTLLTETSRASAGIVWLDKPFTETKIKAYNKLLVITS